MKIIKKKVLFYFLVLCIPLNTWGYNIKITVKSMPEKEVLLASYVRDKIIAVDTAKLDLKGTGYFHKNKKLPAGEYLLYLSPAVTTNIMVGNEQEFSILVTDTTAIQQNIQYEGSSEQELLVEFRENLTAIFEERQKLDDALKNDPNKDDPNAINAYKEAYSELEEKHRNTGLEFSRKTAGPLSAFFTYYLRPPHKDFSEEIPQDVEDRQQKISLQNWLYAKEHYWDYVDFSDSIILNLHKPSLEDKIKEYLEKYVMLIPHPDSLFKACDELIKKSQVNTGVYRNVLDNCMIYTFDNKIMGMDEAFVKIVQKYYMNGKADWKDAKLLKTITEEAIKRQYNLIGYKAIDLQLPTIDGQVASLYEVKAPFTLVLFWEPNCGHCKKTVPQVKKEIFDKFAPHGLKVFAVNTHTNKKEWEDFVAKNELYDFINVWDPNRQSNYWTIYNVFSTPVMYILDKDKKIIAKNLAVDQMIDLLKNEYKKQGIKP